MRRSYEQKLRDPRWQIVRHRILERDDWTCQWCGCRKGERPLHVHHKRYRGEPWDVPDEWLETLCEDCHEGKTERQRRGRLPVRPWWDRIGEAGVTPDRGYRHVSAVAAEVFAELTGTDVPSDPRWMLHWDPTTTRFTEEDSQRERAA